MKRVTITRTSPAGGKVTTSSDVCLTTRNSSDASFCVDRRYKTEYRKKYRPFSLYQYVDGRVQKPAMAAAPAQNAGPEQAAGGRIETERRDTWYREVVELRKKAGEYKVSHLWPLSAQA